jgi:hypothetical protein
MNQAPSKRPRTEPQLIERMQLQGDDRTKQQDITELSMSENPPADSDGSATAGTAPAINSFNGGIVAYHRSHSDSPFSTRHQCLIYEVISELSPPHFSDCPDWIKPLLYEQYQVAVFNEQAEHVGF